MFAGIPETAPYRSRRLRIAALACAFALVSQACGTPTADTSSSDGKQQILDATNIDLTSGDCAAAITAITPLYDSAYTDDNVRMIASTAYGCNAHINFLNLLSSLVSNLSSLSSGPWAYMQSLFPSAAGQDYVVEGALLGTDSLQSILEPGALVLPLYQVNPGTWNVGSDWPSDRTGDANFYMVFMEMAAIGGIESRFGSPLANHDKGANLPWNTAAAMDTNGAAYAASLLNFVDALGAAGTIFPTAAQSSMTTLASTALAAFNLACQAGCAGTPANGGATLQAEFLVIDPHSNWQDTGCRTTCSSCPQTLRNRAAVTDLATDTDTCAAAGLVNLINVAQSPVGWPGPP